MQVGRLALPLLWAAVAAAGCGGGGTSEGPTAPGPAAAPAAAPAPPPASGREGLAGKLVLGYQGWYGCPGDFDGNAEWVHWFVGAPAVENLVVDMLPATEGLAAGDTCDTGLTRRDGTPLKLFSSQNPRVVDHHFRLMAQQGVGAVALQRFVNQLDGGRLERRVDNVLRHALAAAERHALPLYLSYDVTGADPATAVQKLRADWQRIAGALRLGERAGYLRDGGKPVLQLWGFGFVRNPGTPQEVAALVAELKSGAGGAPAATLVGGVPTHWRALRADAKTDPAWKAVYLSFDVLSPWAVGRYADEAQADAFFADVVAGDMAEAARAGVRYLPVIFPGFSWYNLMRVRGTVDPALLNKIPRQCGRFLAHQASLAVRHRAEAIYGAMFDELDESTALLPAQPSKAGFPLNAAGVSLDEDGCALPADWYVRMAGRVAEALRTNSVAALP